jgi:hypothetical protein
MNVLWRAILKKRRTELQNWRTYDCSEKGPLFYVLYVEVRKQTYGVVLA